MKAPLISILLVVTPLLTPQQLQKLTFEDLVKPGADQTLVRDINAQGDMVGSYVDVAGYHGFLLINGEWSTIDVPGAIRTRPKAVNTNRQVVGQYINADSSWHGFLFSDGLLQTIDPPGSTGAASTGAYGINAQGDIVGAYSDAAGVIHGYLLRDGKYTLISGAERGSMWSSATGINARGDIAGMYYEPGDPKMYGYLLRRGEFTRISMASATTMSCPFGINELGQMVGHYDSPMGVVHGFLVSKGVYTEIDVPGAPQTEPLGINPQGDIVGNYLSNVTGTFQAFVIRAGTRGAK